MSFAGYLFGNIDEKGHLDNTDLDKELRESLEKVAEDGDSRLLDQFFSVSSLGLDQEDGYDKSEVASEADVTDVEDSTDQVKHVEDAVDYSDFNEPADDYSDINEPADDQMFSNKYFQRGMKAVDSGDGNLRKLSRFSNVSSDLDDDYDADNSNVENKQTISLAEIQMTQEPAMSTIAPSELMKQSKPTEVEQPPIDVKVLYPAFEKDKILKFSELFAIKIPKRYYKPKKTVTAPLPQELSYTTDDQELFEAPLKNEITVNGLQQLRESFGDFSISATEKTSSITPLPESEEAAEEIQSKAEALKADFKVPEMYHSVVLDSWEDKIVWASDEDDESVELEPSTDTQTQKEAGLLNDVFSFRNYDVEDGDWTESIIWDPEEPFVPCTKLILDLNDTNMLFDTTSNLDVHKSSHHEQKSAKKTKKTSKKAIIQVEAPRLDPKSKAAVDKFNLSNDRYYEALKKRRVRQTFGQLNVQHSLPALKLQSPFFKSKLTKGDLRSFHRPSAQFPHNVLLTVSRVRSGKKKKSKKEFSETIRSSKDLSLKDRSNYILLEFSEEYPSIIQNIGMGSLLINYYRKRDNDDEEVPQLDIGDPFILDVADASPFMNFGNVEPGQTVQTLYNNLMRAPLFKQPARESDFLLIRHTYRGVAKYYIREIPYLFVVGQTYPVQEVPGPHSRKITTTIKNRLQVAAYRLIKKDAQHVLRVSKLAKAFPEYSEGQIRQRLKEFAEFQRKGDVNGCWKLKPHVPLPSEEDIRKMVTPEMVCLYESMLVGQRHLQDAGYGKSADDEEENNEDSESKLDIEEQLAPWITTRNFIYATQGKAMLKLYGPGDPTGRGEGFSFIRVSMKDIFLRAGESAEEKLAEIEARPKSAHRYNVAEQQQIYREEITRIWNAQFKALSSTEEPSLSEDDSEDNLDDDLQSSSHLRSRSPSVCSVDDDLSVSGVGSQNKLLVIKRLVRDKNGETSWQSEVVKDPVVMNAYLRQRQLIEEQTTSVEMLEPTDDEEKNRRMKKRIQDHLATLKRNQERRLARAKAREATLSSLKSNSILSSSTPTKSGKNLPRRCGNCGQLGHMKTNKKCPKYNSANNSGVSTPIPIGDQNDLIQDDEPSIRVEGTRISIPKHVIQKVSDNMRSGIFNSKRKRSDESDVEDSLDSPQPPKK
ncbi:hypothetical protein K493DRAFT_408629 [Basidiobolus meristosporus CBS 931.73]|uniref:Transcription initiation factor TFIID subunit 1 histone acetyltransferase domain-containing protein n=1 Tax=Basidiobolus meristosporus CBS 931.73 TaxID=1314790 RepID=A0A1Y1Y4F5_9FUNG|nr:hypothetical protein K493DRAFT_408629 [Basidiobolus meristosporus CBS 931.73]|eukprot:ORX92912.1 hypothetical protein K493DRAFT_408629 [Basidiobolus meristosporus CBS 931.73]